MKSTLYSMLGVLLLGGTSFAQNNTVLRTSDPAPSFGNVFVGFGSGNNVSNVASTINGLNVFVGFQSGFNANATLGSNTENSRNTFLGAFSGFNNTTGSDNVFLGNRAGYLNTTGSNNVSIKSVRDLNSSPNVMTGNNNTMVGFLTGDRLTSGSNNSLFGQGAGRNLQSGNDNVFLGTLAGSGAQSTTNNICIGNGANQMAILGTNNIFIGTTAAQNLNNGAGNTIIGLNSGENLTAGSFNTFLGRVQIPTTTPNLSNTVVIANGGGDQRFYSSPNGNVGLSLGNNVIPANRLVINATGNGSVANTMGLRFSGIINTNFNPLPATSNRRVLSVNNDGDVILVDDIGGGVNQSCATAGFLTVNSNTANQLACSQVFDNGVGVGVGFSSIPTDPNFFNYNFNSSFYTNYEGAIVHNQGKVVFHVNGNARATGVFTTSDQKFKKDIKPIENALSLVEKIEGKTYLWNQEAFKDRNFDGGGHSGFIAQELEKVLPHVVATQPNGEKAVNYIEVIPYLVEAIKEQQAQIREQKLMIEELTNKITTDLKEEFRAVDQLSTSKIVSVSPNPSNRDIQVYLTIPSNVEQASLQIFDANGRLRAFFTIDERGNSIQKSLLKDNFGAGVYGVSLWINGKKADTQKIIFN
ncbi:Por secretion system C-terminal sorting domain-containing protein [Flavobacterium fontis]|uniref:Por secretion system C-terminal sorting domain-containing protein n=1 Tax=Flavobacterium fontis TaxID=1124188 RepID=A0A1M5CMH4_9FLAO|nr:tail fiber domain-containing protein [Flavobacterium fontis]SHF55928.1 Por secretion system C-terminal sorting domain-containing protein [Flavobacterium fontis]